jgi:antitoxin component YwqK of YwqJK toxin-antitoxin module
MKYKPVQLLIIFISFSVFFNSCSESTKKEKKIIHIDSIIYKPGTKEPFNGKWTGNIDSTKIEFDVVNGKKEGNFKIYFPNGNIQISGHMKNNLNIGEWKYYYENGNVESTGLFINDTPSGKWLWYYPDSTLKQIGYFNFGRRDSIWKTYDTLGNLIDSRVFDSDTTVVTADSLEKKP